MSLYDEFTDWIYENYSVGNGDRLITLMEDTNIQDKFLRDMDLPLETEII